MGKSKDKKDKKDNKKENRKKKSKVNKKYIKLGKYGLNSLSTNVIKEKYEDIYLNCKNNFIQYQNDINILVNKQFKDDTKINYKNSYDIYKRILYKNRPDYKLVADIKLMDPNRFPIKDKYLPKHKRKICEIDITKDIVIHESNYYLNTPLIITYQNKDFKISGNNYVNQYECTWKCALKRKRIKNNKDKNFCEATIKGKRDEKFLNIFKFYMKKEHSENCIKFNENINKTKPIDININNNNKTENKESIIEDNISNSTNISTNKSNNLNKS